jgi:cytochrome bd-type quinol oxidase subunit 1
MNYPVWNPPLLGGSLVVAIIAIIHVLISHLAIGGGAFMAIAEIWSDRQPDGERVRAWLHRFATFFLVYTTVFGAMTGVGIWFSIQLASPDATSLLIHQFVFAWAIEWVLFLAELTVLYLYYYGWAASSRSLQRALAIAYFVIAWLSLFVINGILTFMLEPGRWTLENRDLAAAFFNPGFAPSLVLRTVVMLLLGGLFGLFMAARIEDDGLKERIVRFSAGWVLPAAVIVPVAGLWYWSTLPVSAVKIFEGGVVGAAGARLEAMARYFWLAATSGALIVVGTLFAAARPKALHAAAAIALLLTAQLGVMGGEFFREMARKPYVVHDVLYGNGLWKKDAADPQRLARPYLDAAKWDPQPAPLTRAHGEWIYRIECASCHTLGGYRSLAWRTRQWTPAFGPKFLEKLDQLGVMPPFQGTLEDRAALTSFLLALNGGAATPAEVLRAQEVPK